MQLPEQRHPVHLPAYVVSAHIAEVGIVESCGSVTVMACSPSRMTEQLTEAATCEINQCLQDALEAWAAHARCCERLGDQPGLTDLPIQYFVPHLVVSCNKSLPGLVFCSGQVGRHGHPSRFSALHKLRLCCVASVWHVALLSELKTAIHACGPEAFVHTPSLQSRCEIQIV